MLKEHFIKWTVVAALLATLAGCANSVLLSAAYDRFGSGSAKRFKSYADFDQQQVKQIDKLAAGYHAWHRATELPRYANLLREMINQIKTEQPLTYATAEKWWTTVRAYSDDMRTCNPFNVSADLLAGLSDKQVQQIANSLRADLNEREDDYLAESEEQRVQRRFKEITKWGARAGASFNQQQKALLDKTLRNQISMGKQRYELRRIWMENFVILLEQRKQPGFKNKISSHIDKTWNLTSNGFPDKWQKNEQLWTGFIKDYINLQSSEQRDKFFTKARSTAATFDKLALKRVEDSPVCHSRVVSD